MTTVAPSSEQMATINNCSTLVNPPTILWIHTGNTATSSVLNSFKKLTSNYAVIIEKHSVQGSIEYFSRYGQCIEIIVTEKGFYDYDTCGKKWLEFAILEVITAVRRISSNVPIIVNSVKARQEPLRSQITNSGAIVPEALNVFNVIAEQNEQLKCAYDFISSLFMDKNSGVLPRYPSAPFTRVISIYHINKRPQHESRYNFNLGNDRKYVFHSTYNLANIRNICEQNFDTKMIGTYSGNAGCFGRGIYFSTRAHMPMFLGLSYKLPIALACQVAMGITDIVDQMSGQEIVHGTPIQHHSNISRDGIEVVIRSPDQIIPSYIICYEVTNLTLGESYTWSLANGQVRIIPHKLFIGGATLDMR